MTFIESIKTCFKKQIWTHISLRTLRTIRFKSMSKRYKDHEKIGVILANFVKNSKLKNGLENVQIEKAWQELMGKGVQNYTSSVKIYKGTLYVYLTSSVLRQELGYGKDKIIALINDHMGRELVKKIILK